MFIFSNLHIYSKDVNTKDSYSHINRPLVPADKNDNSTVLRFEVYGRFIFYTQRLMYMDLEHVLHVNMRLSCYCTLCLCQQMARHWNDKEILNYHYKGRFMLNYCNVK